MGGAQRPPYAPAHPSEHHPARDEFFSLPLFPQALCDEDTMRARNVSCTCGNSSSTTGLGCGTTYGAGVAGASNPGCPCSR